MGRFITEDPIKDGNNWYMYCRNNPMTYIDPTGLLTTSEGMAKAGYDGNGNYNPNKDQYSGGRGPGYGKGTGGWEGKARFNIMKENNDALRADGIIVNDGLADNNNNSLSNLDSSDAHNDIAPLETHTSTPEAVETSTETVVATIDANPTTTTTERITPEVSNTRINAPSESMKQFIRSRANYIKMYKDNNLPAGTVINETRVSCGNTASHRRRTMSSGTLGNLFVSDYVAPVGTGIYTGRKNIFSIDALAWSYGDNKEYKDDKGNIIAIGQGFGRRLVSSINVNGDRQQLVYAHLDNKHKVDKDFIALQDKAKSAGLTFFSLPGGVLIGVVGITGTTTGPHLHYERNQIAD